MGSPLFFHENFAKQPSYIHHAFHMTIYIADNAMFMSIYAKIDIDKTGAFEYETTFFAGKDAKTGHKSASNMADKLLCIPVWASRRPGSAPPRHPGLHTAYTRVSSGFASCF